MEALNRLIRLLKAKKVKVYSVKATTFNSAYLDTSKGYIRFSDHNFSIRAVQTCRRRLDYDIPSYYDRRRILEVLRLKD